MPNNHSYTVILSACAKAVALQQGKHIHNMIEKQKLPLDNKIGTALINLYAKCGDTELANQVYYLLH